MRAGHCLGQVEQRMRAVGSEVFVNHTQRQKDRQPQCNRLQNLAAIHCQHAGRHENGQADHHQSRKDKCGSVHVRIPSKRLSCYISDGKKPTCWKNFHFRHNIATDDWLVTT